MVQLRVGGALVVPKPIPASAATTPPGVPQRHDGDVMTVITSTAITLPSVVHQHHGPVPLHQYRGADGLLVTV